MEIIGHIVRNVPFIGKGCMCIILAKSRSVASFLSFHFILLFPRYVCFSLILNPRRFSTLLSLFSLRALQPPLHLLYFPRVRVQTELSLFRPRPVQILTVTPPLSVSSGNVYFAPQYPFIASPISAQRKID